MSLPDALVRARAAHDALMLDEVAVTRETLGPLNEATLNYVKTATTVYAGPARVKAAASRTVDAAGAAVVTGRPQLHLPYDGDGAEDVRAGDRVTVTAGPLAGGVALVVSVDRATSQTCRVCVIEVTQ